MRIREVSANPGDSFSSGVNKGSDAVDKLFSPSQWGKGGSSSEPASKLTRSKPTGPVIKLKQHQVRDAEAIMQAVVDGDVSALSRQQQELAKNFLEQLKRL
jgi:hypothetical protein